MKYRERHFIFSWLFFALLVTSPLRAQSGVAIEVDQFGVGQVFRPAGITAVRLKLTSNLGQPTPVWVQWQVPNADGDVGEYGRSLTLNANASSLVWVYAPLPPDTSPSSVWTVRVFEERDGQRQGEIGGSRISPGGAPMFDYGVGMIAVVGLPRLGLDGYSNATPTLSRTVNPPGAHEDTRIASGIRPSQLPDRWFGLLPYEALAWAGDHPPQDLGMDQAEAVREYVSRGGHLIISLPTGRNIWGLGVMGQTDLEDLLPCRDAGRVPRTDEAVPLEALLPVLSKFNNVKTLTGARKPPEFSIRVFKDLKGGEGDFNVIDNHYEPLIALQDGRVIAIQRQFGFGRVTVIGIDLSDGRLTGLGLPQADAFWNRVLGRRCDTPTNAELSELSKAEKLGRPDMNHENPLGSGPLITSKTNMEAQAGKGLLLALLLFGVYWLLAGPGGFALLKHYGKVQHAWVAFAACAALFTVIAWGGVSLFPKRTEISHVTFLDHVARRPDDPRGGEPQYQRAVSFFSAYMPDYGHTPISIASIPEQRDLLVSWTPPGPAPNKFPNVNRFGVDVARRPGDLALPSRSTATSLYAHWMGGLDRDWGGTLLVDPNNPIVVDSNESSLRGRIINELPGRLTNVTVIWVKSNRLARRRYATIGGFEQPHTAGLTGAPLNTTVMWRRAATPEWETGGAFDLSTLSGPGDPMINNLQKRHIEPYARRDITGAAGIATVTDNDGRNYMEIMSLFQQINPPAYLKGSETLETGVAFHRELGREVDLSPWFNRPCIIIMGFLEDAALPIPLRIDGRADLPVSRSLTMVRWIYPLPLNEKIAFNDVFDEPE